MTKTTIDSPAEAQDKLPYTQQILTFSKKGEEKIVRLCDITQDGKILFVEYDGAIRPWHIESLALKSFKQHFERIIRNNDINEKRAYVKVKCIATNPIYDFEVWQRITDANDMWYSVEWDLSCLSESNTKKGICYTIHRPSRYGGGSIAAGCDIEQAMRYRDWWNDRAYDFNIIYGRVLQKKGNRINKKLTQYLRDNNEIHINEIIHLYPPKEEKANKQTLKEYIKHSSRVKKLLDGFGELSQQEKDDVLKSLTEGSQ